MKFFASIPNGTIKSHELVFCNPSVSEFQFQMVRLKDCRRTQAERAAGFQFQMVRLKETIEKFLKDGSGQFQFQMVRLKDDSLRVISNYPAFQFQMVRLKASSLFRSGLSR